MFYNTHTHTHTHTYTLFLLTIHTRGKRRCENPTEWRSCVVMLESFSCPRVKRLLCLLFCHYVTFGPLSGLDVLIHETYFHEELLQWKTSGLHSTESDWVVKDGLCSCPQIKPGHCPQTLRSDGSRGPTIRTITMISWFEVKGTGMFIRTQPDSDWSKPELKSPVCRLTNDLMFDVKSDHQGLNGSEPAVRLCSFQKDKLL